MVSRPSQITFCPVSVFIPSQVRGSEAEEEWQEVDWVRWDQGELTVDGEGFLMVFKPSGGKVKPIPMGNLIGAALAGDSDDSQRTLVVNASDATYRQVRISFETAQKAAEFQELGQRAQAVHADASDRDEAPGMADAVLVSELISALKEKYSARCPLIFDGADLYGPAENADHEGTENLLGSGAIMLLDPEESEDKVGQYSLLFFEDSSKPLKTFTIGPQMLKRVADEEDGPGACFEFRSTGVAVHQLAFSDVDTALSFARDFRVRAKLMDVALKTVSRGRQVQEARGKVDELRRNSLQARLFRFFCAMLVLLLVGVTIRVALLYKLHPGKAPKEYLAILVEECFHVLQLLRSTFSSAGSQVCEVAFGAIAAPQLQRCLELGGVSKINECVTALLPPM
jgi:hypothetical protein